MQHDKKRVNLYEAITLFKDNKIYMINCFFSYFTVNNLREFYQSDKLKIGEFNYEGNEYIYRFHGNGFSIKHIDNSNRINVEIFDEKRDFIDDLNMLRFQPFEFIDFLLSKGVSEVINEENSEIFALANISGERIKPIVDSGIQILAIAHLKKLVSTTTSPITISTRYY